MDAIHSQVLSRCQHWTNLLTSSFYGQVDNAEHVTRVAALVDELSPDPSAIRLLPAIESAIGVLNLREIATADSRVDALIVRRLSLGWLPHATRMSVY